MAIEKYKKIAFIAGTLGTGGAERQLFYLLNNLITHDYHPIVICLTRGEFWEQPIINLGIKVHYAGGSKSRVKRLTEILKIIKKERPNLIYSFHFYTNMYAGVVGYLMNIMTLGSIRSNGTLEKKANGWVSWLHYSLPNTIIANSEHGRKNCFELFYKKTSFVLQNVIDISAFAYNEKKQPKSYKFIFVGRFDTNKQPLLFPELINLLALKGIDCHGEMYGNGSLKTAVQNKIHTQYPHLSVSLMDAHPHIQDIYKTAHCLVILSRYEGTPNVVLEAMASGVPVAALNFEGIDEIIESEQSGIIAQTIDELAEKLNAVIVNNGFVVLKENARFMVSKKYALNNQLINFETILTQLN